MIFKLVLLSILSLITSARMSVTQYKLKQKELKDVRYFIEGFIEGAIGAQFDSFANCELDAIFEFQSIVKVVRAFANKQDQEAITDIEEMVQALPKIAEKCPTGFRDIIMLADWKDWVKNQIANPKVFIEHALESILVNKGDIRSKFEDAINNYKADDFFNMGIDIGSLISECSLGQNRSHHPQVTSDDNEQHPWFTEVVDRDAPLEHDVVSEYDENVYNQQFAKMEARDTASYELLVGFVERAKELTPNSEDLIRNPNLNLSHYEQQFNNTRMLIFKPIQASFRLYKFQKLHDPNESMAAWRVLRPLSHIFLDYIEELENNRDLINDDLIKFIQQKSWSLQSYEADDNNTEVMRLIQKAYDLFQAKQFEDNYTACGEVLADIAWILENPEKNHVDDSDNGMGLYVHHQFGLHHLQGDQRQFHQKSDGFNQGRDGYGFLQ